VFHIYIYPKLCTTINCGHANANLLSASWLEIPLLFFWLSLINCNFVFQYIEKFRALAKEILILPSIEHCDMIRLDCEDLKRGLAEAARGLAELLLNRVATDHRNENKG
jgi:hypothetical protein